MAFAPDLFTIPEFTDVKGFSGGRCTPFQQAHVLGDQQLAPKVEQLFRLLNSDFPTDSPDRLHVDQKWNGVLLVGGASAWPGAFEHSHPHRTWASSPQA